MMATLARSPPTAGLTTPTDLPVAHVDEHQSITIRIATGTGTGPTRLAAFDAALASIGAERYNLVRLSSIIPSAADIVDSDDLATLGDVGDRLHAVRAVASTGNAEPATAGLGWARTDAGTGIFYEATATGTNAESSVEADLAEGIEHGLDIRSWTADSRGTRLASTPGTDDGHACALVLAAYGDADAPW